MHDLISRVLDQRDLSRARDLFSLRNDFILNDIEQICHKLADIFSARSYVTDTNSQSVVEIAIARITAAIRENNAVEICAVHLINMLDQCIKYNVNRIDKSEENPPHAKLASDILSCIFLHYNINALMTIAVPVAMKILRKNNRELVCSTSSYLVLASIQHPKLFSKFANCIINSILDGNSSLVRLLPQLYSENKDTVIANIPKILQLFDLFDSNEKTIILNLCVNIVDTKPEVLVGHLQQLESLLSCRNSSIQVSTVLRIFLSLVNTGYAFCLRNNWSNFKQVALSLMDRSNSSTNFTTINSMLLTSLRIFIGIGKLNEHLCKDAIDFLISLSCKFDQNLIDPLYSDLLPLIELYSVAISTYLQNYPLDSNITTRGCVQKLMELCETVELSTLPATSDNLNQATLISLPGISKFEDFHLQISNVTNDSNFVDSSNDSLKSSLSFKSGATTVDSYTNLLLMNGNNYMKMDPKCENSIDNPSYGLHQVSQGVAPRMETYFDDPTDKTSENDRCPTNDSRSHRSSGSAIFYGFRSSNNNLSSPFRSKSSWSNKASRIQREKQLEKISWHTSVCVGNDQVNLDLTRYQLEMCSAAAGTSIKPDLMSNGSLAKDSYGLRKSREATVTVPVTVSNAFDATESRVVTTFSRDASISARRTGSGHVLMTMIKIASDENNNGISSKDVTSKSNAKISTRIFPSPISITKRLDEKLAKEIYYMDVSESSIHDISVHLPFKGSDAIRQFYDKHLPKIKLYVEEWSKKCPAPCQCIVEDVGHRNYLRIQFYCQAMGEYCLYKLIPFTFRTKQPAIWLQLMFLHLQARSPIALNSSVESVQKLKSCWNLLPQNLTKSKSFTALVTSAFPTNKEQQLVLKELQTATYFDQFSYNSMNNNKKWCCFPCNNPAKVQHFLRSGDGPVIEGQLKEKKGRWKFFKRWRTRYFTLSGATLFCRASESATGDEKRPAIDIRTVRSVKSLNGGKKRDKDRRQAIPKAFEIFVDDHNSYIFKARDRKDAEEWFQCLQIAVAQVQKDRISPVKMLL